MNARDAQGQWRLVRGGFIVERRHKVLDYQCLGLDADQIKGRAVDAAGNAGGWETYTFSVADNEDADWVRYVDTGGNDTTGDGSIGNPWATVTKAVTEAQSALTSGQVAVVFLSDDQTWAHTGTLLTGSATTSCLIRFVRRGNGAARPELTFSANTTAFVVGKKGVLHIDGVDVTTAASTSGWIISAIRSGGVAADQDAWNLMVVDSNLAGSNYQVHVNNGLTAADRDDPCFQFLAFQNVEFSASRAYYIYGFFYVSDMLWRDCTFARHTGSNPNEFTRTWAIGRTFVAGCHFDISGDSSTRFWTSRAVDGDDIYSMREVTFTDCSWYADNAGEICNFGIDTDQTGDSIIRDVRLADCSMIQGRFIIATSGSYGPTTSRIDFLECMTTRNGFLTVNVSPTAVHNSIRLRNCGAALPQYAGGAFLILTSGGAANYALGCFQIDGCWLWFGAGNNEGRYFLEASTTGTTLSRAQLIDRIASMDYNHVGKADANTTNWVRNPGEGNQTLATWKANTPFDVHSTNTLNTTFDLTNSGSDALGVNFDFRLATGTGPLAGTGVPLPLGVSIDADGYLRSATTPDAGPYEYGATDTPDDPELPAPSNASRMRRHGLVLGLRLRP